MTNMEAFLSPPKIVASLASGHMSLKHRSVPNHRRNWSQLPGSALQIRAFLLFLCSVSLTTGGGRSLGQCSQQASLLGLFW